MKKIKKFIKNNYIMITSILVVTLMAIIYGALNANLSINGTSNISTTWEVLITNITEIEKNNADTNNVKVLGPHEAMFNVSFTGGPGSYAIYRVTVQNKGNVTAYVTGVTGLKEANMRAPQEIIFECENLGTGLAIPVNSTKTFTIKARFDEKAASIPSVTSKNINLGITVTQDSKGMTLATKTSLKKSIENAQSIIDNIDDYIPSTVINLPALLGEAKEVYADLEATQEEVDDIHVRLTREALAARLKPVQ